MGAGFGAGLGAGSGATSISAVDMIEEMSISTEITVNVNPPMDEIPWSVAKHPELNDSAFNEETNVSAVGMPINMVIPKLICNMPPTIFSESANELTSIPSCTPIIIEILETNIGDWTSPAKSSLMLSSPVTVGGGGGVTMLIDATSTVMLATFRDIELIAHWIFNSALNTEVKELPHIDVLMLSTAGMPGRTTTLQTLTSGSVMD